MTAGDTAARSPSAGILRRAARRLGRLASPDPARFAYATNIALVTILSLFVAFLFNLQNTYWALISIPFVAQMGSGITIWRSVMRLLGTLVGGVVGIAIVALFAQSPVASLAALALWAFGVGFLARLEMGLDAYAYGTAGLTATVIVFDTGPSADAAYGLMLARITETLIPIGAAFAVLLVVFPQSVRRTLENGLLDARDRVMAIVREAATPAAQPAPADRQAATKALATAYSNLRAFKFERSHRGPDLDRVAAAANALNHVLIAAETLSLVLDHQDEGATPAEPEALLDELRALLGAIPPRFHDAGTALALAGRFRDFVARIDGDATTRLSASQAPAGSSDALAVIYAIRRFANTIASFAEAEATVFDPARPAPRRQAIVARYPDYRAAAERGLRPALLLLVLSALWIATASPTLLSVALLSGTFSLVLPTIAPRPALTASGLAIGLGIAAMVPPVLALETVLPYVESFPPYALLIGLTMFVFFYIGSAPGRLIYAFGGSILLAVALRPSNMQVYDPLGLFNALAGLALLPACIAVAFTVIVPEDQGWLRRHLARASRRLLRRAARGRDAKADEFLAQSLDAISDYGGDLDLAESRNRALLARSRIAVTAGLELYELHRLRRLGHLPRDLAGLVPDLGAALVAAAEGRPSAEGTEPFRAAETRARAALAAEGASGPERAATLRFLIGARFLGGLLDHGRLAPQGRA